MTLRVVLEDYGENENGKLNKPHSFAVICKSISVNLNSYKEADTFEAEIDFKNFPFDPRTIRSAGVTIHIADRKKLFKTDNALNLLVPTKESTVFQGFVDEDTISLDSENRTVRLSGRDFTSLLLDQEYIDAPIMTSTSLDVVIRGLLDEIPQTKVDPAIKNSGIEIVNKTGFSLTTLANYDDNKSPNAGARNSRKKRSYWDKIQELIADSGLIAYISLDKLIISNPRTLYSETRNQSRVFVYGTNLSSLEYSRKLGRQKNINIRMVATDYAGKDVIKINIPEQASLEWAKSIGVVRKEATVPVLDTNGNRLEDKAAPYLTFNIRKVKDSAELIKAGEKVYEELGRQQLEGTLKTKEMAVCTLGSKKPDGTDDIVSKIIESTLIRVGDSIEVSIDQGDLHGMPDLIKLVKDSDNIKDKEKRLKTRTQAQTTIKNYLIRNCYSTEVAEAMSESLSKFDTPFYVKSVQYSLGQDSGFEMEIQFINFIELPKSLRNQPT